MKATYSLLGWFLLALVSSSAAGQELTILESSRILLQLTAENAPNSVSVTDIEFAPAGESIAIGANDGTVRLLPVAEGARPKTIAKSSSAVQAIEFSPDGKLIAWAAHRGVRVSSLQDGDVPFVPGDPLSGSACVALSPDGKLLAIGNYYGSSTLHDLETAEIRFQMDPFAGAGPVDSGLYKPTTESLDFSPDGKLLVVTSDFFDDELSPFKNLQVWDTQTGKLRFFFRGGHAEFSPDGKLLAYRSQMHDRDGRIILLDLETFLPVGALTGSFHRGKFSPDGRTIAALTKQWLELWTIEPPTQGGRHYNCRRAVLLKHRTEFRSFAFSPDGRSIATGDNRGTVRLWRIANESE